jgi:hypothetical protein
MKNSISGIAAVIVLVTALGPTTASTAPATAAGAMALAVAGVIAPYSTALNPGERKVIASLFNGNARVNYPISKLSVAADSVTCRISSVAIAERSCEITFKKGKASLKGRAANELFATLAAAGVTAEGTAGSSIESISKLSCTIDPGEIKQNAGGGADCSWQSGP